MNRRTFGLSTLGVLTAGLALGVPAAALAEDAPQRHALRGTVTSKGTNSLGVAVKQEDGTTKTVTVTLAQNARVQVPGAHGRQQRLGAASLSSIVNGDEVVAQGHYTSANAFEARRLHLVPGSRSVHAVGTAAVNGTTVTVTKSDSTKVVFTTNGDTKIRPEGKKLTDIQSGTTKVTVVGRRQANGDNLATGVVIHNAES